jgi:tetratricopeptide (TPR) repeat protein
LLSCAFLIGAPINAQNSPTIQQLSEVWTKIGPSATGAKKTPADPAAIKNLIRMADSTIKAHPDLAAAYLIRADALLHLSPVNASAVMQDLSKVNQLTPNNGHAFFLRGILYHSLGRNADALKDWRRAALELKQGPAAASLGEYYEGNREYKQALPWFDLAIKLEPEAPRSYFLSGVCHDTLLEPARAVDDYSKAIALYSKMDRASQLDQLPYLYHQRAVSYATQEKYEKAIADLDSEIALRPTVFAEYRLRAKLYGITGNYKRAIENLTIFIDKDSEPAHAMIERAAMYRKLHQFDAAIKDCAAAIKLIPQEPEAYQLRGECYADQKHFSAALADMDTASKRESMSTHALAKKAQIQEMMADKAGAAKTRAEIKDLEDDLKPGKTLGR